MQRFYWLIDGVLAGCSRPGHRGYRPGNEAMLDEDIVWLKQQGIDAVVSLTEEPLLDGALARHGLVELHLPVDDLTPPTTEQIADALAFIDRQIAEERAIAIHCLMGQGRTGTVLAAYLIRDGSDAESAIAEVRSVCPGAIESPAQVSALERYASRKEWFI